MKASLQECHLKHLLYSMSNLYKLKTEKVKNNSGIHLELLDCSLKRKIKKRKVMTLLKPKVIKKLLIIILKAQNCLLQVKIRTKNKLANSPGRICMQFCIRIQLCATTVLKSTRMLYIIASKRLRRTAYLLRRTTSRVKRLPSNKNGTLLQLR